MAGSTGSKRRDGSRTSDLVIHFVDDSIITDSDPQRLPGDKFLGTGRTRRIRQFRDRLEHPVLYFLGKFLDSLDYRPKNGDPVLHELEDPRRICLIASKETDSCGPLFASS